MKRVLLTSGPRGAGKSEYVKVLSMHHPEVAVLSRDDILLSLFNSTALSPYEGGHEYALTVMFDRLKELLTKESSVGTVVLDCWNGTKGERANLLRKLRELGAEEVVCLYFVVPVDICVEQFFKKRDSKGYSAGGIARDHGLFYKFSDHINDEGFDKLIEVYPTQLRFAHFPFL